MRTSAYRENWGLLSSSKVPSASVVSIVNREAPRPERSSYQSKTSKTKQSEGTATASRRALLDRCSERFFCNPSVALTAEIIER